MNKILTTLVVFAGFIATAQVKVGDNPTDINANALLEMESTNKGMLLPRVALTNTTAFAPLSAHVAGMTVYNTATAGDVVPGFYYNDGTKWARLGNVAVSVTAVSPIHSVTGRVWMDRNLGASRKAQSVDDIMAYGQLYQWGRGNDGHADINWASATTGTPVYGTTTTLSTGDYPNNNLFITTGTAPFDWRATQNDNLWQGVNGINNPCPAGYRLPTDVELATELVAYNITNSATAFASPLKFTVPGFRSPGDGSLYDVGSYGYYRSSSVSGTKSSSRYFYSGGTSTYNFGRAIGFSVRCTKD